VVCVALAALVALAGCGSSKPAYCSTRTNLENLIKATSGLETVRKAQFDQIQRDANTLVSQAKSDFPSQTSAIKSSMDALVSAVNALPVPIPAGQTPIPASQMARLASAASSVVSSVKSFVDATNSKCS
jgi:hypothetical protein